MRAFRVREELLAQAAQLAQVLGALMKPQGSDLEMPVEILHLSAKLLERFVLKRPRRNDLAQVALAQALRHKRHQTISGGLVAIEHGNVLVARDGHAAFEMGEDWCSHR